MNSKPKSLQSLLDAKSGPFATEIHLPAPFLDDEVELSCSSVQLFESSSDFENIFSVNSANIITNLNSNNSQELAEDFKVNSTSDDFSGKNDSREEIPREDIETSSSLLVSDLRSQVTNLEQDNVTLVEELDKVTKNSEELHAQIGTLAEELQLSQTSYKELTQQLARLEQSKKMLVARTNSTDNLQAEHDALKGDQEVLLQEANDLRGELSSTKAQCEAFKVDNNNNRLEITKLRNQLSKVSLDFESVKSQLEIITRERDSLYFSVQQSQQSSQSELESVTRGWEQKLRDSESHRRRLEDQCRSIQNELADQCSSRSREMMDIDRFQLYHPKKTNLFPSP